MIQDVGDGNERDLEARGPRWQAFLERTTLSVVAGSAGVVLYLSLFPSFYYMDWLFFGVLLWTVVAAGCLLQLLGLRVGVGWRRSSLRSSPATGIGFIVGMVAVVSLLVAFKVPLHASFLLARPGLEEALAEHGDDLSQVGIVSHNYGIYQFQRAERRCHREDRVFFRFLDDAEAAIVYSESGIHDLCYNSGNKGHLFGNWYWIKED